MIVLAALPVQNRCPGYADPCGSGCGTRIRRQSRPAGGGERPKSVTASPALLAYSGRRSAGGGVRSSFTDAVSRATVRAGSGSTWHRRQSLIDNDSHYHIGGRFLKGLLEADRIERVQGAPQRPPMRHPARCVNVLPEVIRLTVMIDGCHPFSRVRASGDSTIGAKTRIRSANDERKSWQGSDRRKPFRHPRSSAPCFTRDSIRPSRLATELIVLSRDRISRLIETVGRWSR